jgi:hypothetical protein
MLSEQSAMNRKAKLEKMQQIWEQVKREYETHKNTRQNISEIIDGNLDKLRLDGNEIKISNCRVYINVNNTYLARMDFSTIVDEKTTKIDLAKVAEQWNRSLKVLHTKLRQQDFFSISTSMPSRIFILCDC